MCNQNMANLIPIVAPEQIKELRQVFFEKLVSEGAPSTCVGKLNKIKVLAQNNSIFKTRTNACNPNRLLAIHKIP